MPIAPHPADTALLAQATHADACQTVPGAHRHLRYIVGGHQNAVEELKVDKECGF